MATFDVLLPVKNGISFLASAIDSVMSQTFKDWRLLILDHSSTDGSRELAQIYQKIDKRISVHSYAESLSFSELLNQGLGLCDGKYTLRHDADDICMPDRMEVLALAFDKHPDVCCMGSLGDIIDGTGIKRGVIDMPTGQFGVYPLFLFRNPVAHPAACFRLQSLRDLNASYGKDFVKILPSESRLVVPGLAEDYFLFGQLALVSRCMNLPNKLISYRWHYGNVSALRQNEQLQLALTISRYLAQCLSTRYGVTQFDPAPFCNHGERLYRLAKDNFDDDFRMMHDILEKCMPLGPHFSREMAFREVLANRKGVTMAQQYARFVMKHGVRQSEWRTIKSWQLRVVRPRSLVTA